MTDSKVSGTTRRQMMAAAFGAGAAIPAMAMLQSAAQPVPTGTQVPGNSSTDESARSAVDNFRGQLARDVGAALIGYSSGGTKITVGQALDVLYYGIANIKNPQFAGGATGDGTTPERDLAAWKAAIASGMPNIYVPAGVYLTGKKEGFLFGNQSTTGQSQAPLTLLADGWGTVFKAAPGFSGTVLQGWSLAGVRWGSFNVDGNGTANHCIDTDWRAGVGPSQQNYYSFIRCYNAVGDSVWRCWNNNDTRFDSCMVTCTKLQQKGFDLNASGGLVYMNNCIWNGGYLNLACQNGVIRDSWGHGIQFAGSALNYISLSGNYIYPNGAKKACLWSESFAPYQSVRSLICDSTQFIGGDKGTCFFDLNMYSGAIFNGCQFIDSNAMTMWGSNSRSDSYATVKNLFNRGSMGTNCARNTPGRYLNEYDGFMNDVTGTYFSDERHAVFASGGNSGTFAANIWYDLIAAGQLTQGTYVISMDWTQNGPGKPGLFHASTLMAIPATTHAAATAGPAVPAILGEHAPGAGTTLAFRIASAGDRSMPKVQFMCNTSLLAPGSFYWKASKIA